MTEQHMPAAIAAVVAGFGRDITGATVETKVQGPNRWRITVTNDRVEMWVEYQVLSRGRLQMKNSKLFRDGKPAARANSYGQLVNIFADPNGDGYDEETTQEVIASATEVDPGDAPPEVRHAYRILSGRNPKGLVPVLRRKGVKWAVCMENDRIKMGMLFSETLMDHTRPLRPRGARLVDGDAITLTIDGEDYTEMVAGRVEKALELINRNGHQAAPGAPAIGKESSASGFSGVDVRKQTVIRT